MGMAVKALLLLTAAAAVSLGALLVLSLSAATASRRTEGFMNADGQLLSAQACTVRSDEGRVYTFQNAAPGLVQSQQGVSQCMLIGERLACASGAAPGAQYMSATATNKPVARTQLLNGRPTCTLTFGGMTESDLADYDQALMRAWVEQTDEWKRVNAQRAEAERELASERAKLEQAKALSDQCVGTDEDGPDAPTLKGLEKKLQAAQAQAAAVGTGAGQFLDSMRALRVELDAARAAANAGVAGKCGFMLVSAGLGSGPYPAAV